jgi:cyclopropane fatty-acyl-phospholipid synthase-like methyltransferase
MVQVGLKQGQAVLDVGSGLGGPARYLAHKAGVHVVGGTPSHDELMGRMMMAGRG